MKIGSSFFRHQRHGYSVFCIFFFSAYINLPVFGQVPHLPATNLGLTNLQDGVVPAAGWYYLQYIQAYQPKQVNDGQGKAVTSPILVSSLTSLQQVVYISKNKVLDGNIGFTAIVPIVKLSANTTQAISSNPNPLGDIIAGPLIQWSDRRLFGLKYDHRFELDLGIPTGARQTAYDINPGAHLWRIFPHYTFTISATDRLSFSMRHHLNYYFREIGTTERLGMTYNFNYSAEYALKKSIFIECAGYFLKQLEQDSYSGDHSYFQRQYGIADTRESVLGLGPGIGFITRSGLFLELKGMQELSAVNRSQGFRTTLALSYKIN
jgi:hypothetical protein